MDNISGDYLICSRGQGGCGEPFQKGGRALVLTASQIQSINMADGDLEFSAFENQSGLFCSDCLDELQAQGGRLSRRSSRGDYIVSFAWMMRRTRY
jgi:hypothetical protein